MELWELISIGFGLGLALRLIYSMMGGMGLMLLRHALDVFR